VEFGNLGIPKRMRVGAKKGEEEIKVESGFGGLLKLFVCLS